MSARFRLRRSDGEVYLERWGVELGRAGRFGGIFIHHMTARDPGMDLHDHPWWFASFILKGGYYEWRAETRAPQTWGRRYRRRWSWRTTPQRICHSITRVLPDTWTLVVHGPRRSDWGFYTPDGWVFHLDYGDERRGLKTEAHEGRLD